MTGSARGVGPCVLGLCRVFNLGMGRLQCSAVSCFSFVMQYVLWPACLVSYHRLDAIVNNAAQTIRRPAAYYRHLLPLELTPRADLPKFMQVCVCGTLACISCLFF